MNCFWIKVQNPNWCPHCDGPNERTGIFVCKAERAVEAINAMLKSCPDDFFDDLSKRITLKLIPDSFSVPERFTDRLLSPEEGLLLDKEMDWSGIPSVGHTVEKHGIS